MERTGFEDFLIVDSHLDLAENVTLFGRDMTLPAVQLRAIEKRTRQQATATLPELVRGGIAVAIATVTPGFLGRRGRGFRAALGTLSYARGGRGAGVEAD